MRVSTGVQILGQDRKSDGRTRASAIYLTWPEVSRNGVKKSERKLGARVGCKQVLTDVAI